MSSQTCRVSAASLPRKSAEKIFIVASGPSRRGFDLSILRNSYVLAINDSMLSLPWADGVVSCDRTWMDNRAKAIEEFRGAKYLASRSNPSINIRREPGLSEDWSAVHVVGTSGYAALNIAVLLGAKFVGLLGFDYHSPGQHAHANYHWASHATDEDWQSGSVDWDSDRRNRARQRPSR